MASKQSPPDVVPYIKCVVCSEIVGRDPVTLPCDHQLCHNCGKKYAKKTFFCNLCGKQYDNLQKKKRKNAEDDIPCCRKGHDAATVFCKDCHEFYCKVCYGDHQDYDSMSGHKMKPIDDMSTGERKKTKTPDSSNICGKHNRPLSTVCSTCNTLVCETCERSTCSYHILQTINEAANEASKTIESMARQTVKYIDDQELLKRQGFGTSKNVTADVKIVKREIKEAARKLHNIVNKHEKDMLSCLDRYKAQTLKQLESLEIEYEQCKAEATKLKQNIERLMRFGKDIELVQQTPVLQGELKTKTKAKQRLTWAYALSRSQQTEESLKSMFGQINLKTQTILGKPLRQVELKYTGKKMVSGMVVIGDYLCITHTEDPNLWLYDMVNGNCKACPVPGLNDPRGMALVKSEDRTLVITDQNIKEGKLHFVTISTGFEITNAHVKMIPAKQPRKVSSNDGQLLIGQWGSSQFLVCDTKGDVETHITVGTSGETVLFPRCVARTTYGYVALMWDNGFKSTIQWMDNMGKCTAKYISSTRHAPHVVVDNVGRVIMVELLSDELRLVDIDNRQSHLLLTRDDGIDGPMYAYINEESRRLYVAHGQVGSMEVRAYRWPDQTENFDTSTVHLELSIPAL